MRRLNFAAALFLVALPSGAQSQPQPPAQPPPGLLLEISGEPEPAIEGARCEVSDIPDSPARAIRLASGEVQLYATHYQNRVESGPDLLHLRRGCQVVLEGARNDDPAAFDDRAWIAAPWTADGRTIWAVLHNEFQGHLRPAGCPTKRYVDCWYNALTEAVSRDGGRTFQRAPGRALVAALPYRHDQVELGHHGYFNPSNIVTLDGAQYMTAFATRAGVQREGNCLLRTTEPGSPQSWRGWNGTAFQVEFVDPYVQQVPPETHVCTPIGQGAMRWQVTSLVRHQPTGLFIAITMNGGRGGGFYYSTSPDLLRWSGPARLISATGPSTWTCNDSPPLAYPSLLDPASEDRSFETVGPNPVLFATRFNPKDCRTGMDRELLRWPVRITPR